MNEDFSLFFMIKRVKSQSNAVANKNNSVSKMTSCTGVSRMFCEYMNRTGYNENRKG